MSELTCYYYDEQHNRCNCYVNKNLNELLDENTKLHDELAKWERLSAGIDLPDYPVTQFKPKDLERENAKLREELADVPKCETCEAMLDCDECLRADVSHKERRRLSAENAKLQETLQRRNEQFGIMTELWVRQVFDNAKLRELVRDVYSLHWHGADCTECPWFDECDNHGGGCPWLGILANRMSELGIEVDG